MKIATVVIVTLGLASGVHADELYVGGNLGAASFDGIADADQPDFLGPIPGELSIDGLAFESTETAWSVFGGWRIRDWMALELGIRISVTAAKN